MTAKVIAVTGGIGSGQSTVSQMLEEMGCKVVSADLIVHQIVDTNSEVKKELKEEFGDYFFDKNDILDRRALAKYIFSDINITQRLNRIVHPRLVEELIQEIEISQDSNQYRFIVIDAALVFEMAMERFFDVIIVVYSEKDLRIKRVQKRDHLTLNEILERMGNQIDLTEKASWADFVIENNFTFVELKALVYQVFNQLKELKKL